MKPLKKYLENSEEFRKVSLSFHNKKMNFVDKFMDSLHEEAFPETKK